MLLLCRTPVAPIEFTSSRAGANQPPAAVYSGYPDLRAPRDKTKQALLTPLQLETHLGTNILEVSIGRDFGALKTRCSNL